MVLIRVVEAVVVLPLLALVAAKHVSVIRLGLHRVSNAAVVLLARVFTLVGGHAVGVGGLKLLQQLLEQ